MATFPSRNHSIILLLLFNLIGVLFFFFVYIMSGFCCHLTAGSHMIHSHLVIFFLSFFLPFLSFFLSLELILIKILNFKNISRNVSLIYVLLITFILLPCHVSSIRRADCLFICLNCLFHSCFWDKWAIQSTNFY